jgi:hypothetical protein
MNTRDLFRFAVLTAMATTGIATRAQTGSPVDIPWSTVDGGGGTSTGGVYAVIGTSAQPDSGTLSGGTFALQGGFWSAFGVVQIPGAPRLRITSNGAHGVDVRWPAPSTGWVLQETGAFASSPELTVWTDVVTGPEVVNGEKMVNVVPARGVRCYRLRQNSGGGRVALTQ